MFKSSLAKIFTIWKGTYLRAFRDKSLIVVSFFCAFLVLALLVIDIKPETQFSYLLFGVLSCIAPGVIISIFIGNYTVSAEIEDRTLAILFSKPVSRPQFLLGKFFGILSMGLIYYVILGLVCAAVLAVKTEIGEIWQPFIAGMVVWGMFLGVLTALSILFSVIAPGVGGIILTLVVCSFSFIGMIHLRLLTVMVAGTPAKYLLLMVYYLMPNGVFFDINFHNASFMVLFHTFSYALWYILLFLLLAVLFFDKKELG